MLNDSCFHGSRRAGAIRPMGLGTAPLLLLAAAAVALVHAVLPDHWVPLAVVGRAQHWRPVRILRVSGLAAVGHVATSLVLAAVVAIVGLRFQDVIAGAQGRIVGGLLVATGVGFLLWGLATRGHVHEHPHRHGEDETVHFDDDHGRPLRSRLAAIVVPFGVAASPDLTILPVALAAAGSGVPTVVGVLLVFAVTTMVVFMGLTLAGAVVGYQIKGDWLERHAYTITAGVLIAVGCVAFVGL